MPNRAPTPWPVCCVVFDLDGLLIDSEPVFAEAARRLLQRRRLTLCEDVLWRMMGMPSARSIHILRDHYALADSPDDLREECRKHFYDVLADRPVPLLPGALSLLEGLERAGIPRAIATSSRAAYVRRILAPHDVLHRFHFFLSADDVVQAKPDPEIYQKAAARFGVEPQQTLVLEDSWNGLRAAKTAGARCVVVPHALGRPADLAAADLTVPSLDDPRLRAVLGIPEGTPDGCPRIAKDN